MRLVSINSMSQSVDSPCLGDNLSHRTPLGVTKSSSYRDQHCEKMDAFHVGLRRQPDLIPTLPDSTASNVLSYLVGLACQSQNDSNLSIGRRALAHVPAVWLVERLPDIANETLDLTDEWECRRLLELYCCVDQSLANKFAKSCVDSSNPEIVEAGRDYVDDPSEVTALVTRHLNQPLPSQRPARPSRAVTCIWEILASHCGPSQRMKDTCSDTRRPTM